MTIYTVGISEKKILDKGVTALRKYLDMRIFIWEREREREREREVKRYV